MHGPVEVPDHSEETAEGYIRFSRRKNLFLVGLAVILVALSLLTIRLGATDLSFGDIIHYIFRPDSSWESTVVWDLRLKNIVAALLAGAGLGIAGAVMQGILRNPLASPYTLGISNASAFGAAVAIMFLGGGLISGTTTLNLSVDNPALVTAVAFIFAMIATGIILLLVKVTACTPETMVLAGMAINAIFAAGLSFLQYIADDTSLPAIVFWQFGALDKASWSNLYIILAALALVCVYFYYKRWDYNSMEAGEDVARGLGVDIGSTRILGLVFSAVITAIVVSFMGIIGFIGLIAPHIVKRLIGDDFRYLLTGSMLVGALVLLLSNIVGSYAFGMSVPVGIITSFIGGPVFIYILIRGYRRRSTV